MIRRHIAICAAAICGGLPLLAQAISVEPGQWEMSFVMNMPMLTEPQTRTHAECIEESEWEPEDIDMDPGSNCTVTNAEESGNTLKFSMECVPGQGGASRLDWEVTSGGDTMEGKGTMTAEMGGQSMQMSMQWSGRRLGECPAKD